MPLSPSSRLVLRQRDRISEDKRAIGPAVMGILRVNILRAGDDAVVDVHIPAAVHSALIEPEQVCTVL